MAKAVFDWQDPFQLEAQLSAEEADVFVVWAKTDEGVIRGFVP